MRRPPRADLRATPLLALALALAASPMTSCGPVGGTGVLTDEAHEGLLLSKGARPIDAPPPADEPALSRTVYVPIYSHIYLDDPHEVYPLAATLSVRNTDPDAAIVVSSIRYFNTDGSLVRQYLQQPVRLSKLATMEVVVRERDASGGSGANFLVDWRAGAPVSRPIIQAVMIGAAGNQGISFVCPGVDVLPLPPDPRP